MRVKFCLTWSNTSKAWKTEALPPTWIFTKTFADDAHSMILATLHPHILTLKSSREENSLKCQKSNQNMPTECNPACRWEEQTNCWVSELPLLISPFLTLVMCTLPAKKDRTAWVWVGCPWWGLKRIPWTDTHGGDLFIPTWGDQSMHPKFPRSPIQKIVSSRFFSGQ